MASSKRMHWAWAGVFLLGLGMLIAGALNGNIWYDEGYSVALVRQDFAQIWQLTAIDVHPPLYYWMAHAVYLAVGESILAYRLLSVAGMVATALLGPVVVRRMFGERAGLAFSALVLFLPFSQHMAWQIRMYSWSMFTVSVCFLAALRLMSAAHANERAPRIAWAALGPRASPRRICTTTLRLRRFSSTRGSCSASGGATGASFARGRYSPWRSSCSTSRGCACSRLRWARSRARFGSRSSFRTRSFRCSCSRSPQTC